MDDDNGWRLRIPREDALSEIDRQIEVGQSLLDRQIDSPSADTEWRRNFKSWDRANIDLMRLLFVSTEAASEYIGPPEPPTAGAPESSEDEVTELRDHISDKLDRASVCPQTNSLPRLQRATSVRGTVCGSRGSASGAR